MSEVPETGSVWCENSVVGVKTHFHVNLTCFHIKSPHFHTKVWCELNPCFVSDGGDDDVVGGSMSGGF